MAAKRMKRPTSIKLNLMPPYIAAARKTKAALALTVVLCLLVLGGMGLWWRINAAEIARLEDDLRQKQQKAQEVEALKNKANSIRQEVADITNALKVLDEIHKSGEEWESILGKITAWIPEEVRLTALNFEGLPTNAQSVVLTGYTTSVNKLRDFYSQLSQSALFTNVSLIAVDKNGVPVPVVGLPPVLPKEKPKAPEVTTELAPPGQQPSTAPGTGMQVTPPSGGPGVGMQGPAPLSEPGIGMHGGPPSGGPGIGMHGGPPSGGPGIGMHGPAPSGGPLAGPTAPMGPAAPMVGPTMLGAPMMGGGIMGAGQQQAIVRDPVAPRNAVYFVIRATLARPVQVAKTLQPPQPAAMPGAGMMPMGGMPPGAMSPEELAGPEAMSGAPGGTAPPTGERPEGRSGEGLME